MSDESMKKDSETTDLRDEYDFDYSDSRPNRFAARFEKDSVAVVLDSEV